MGLETFEIRVPREEFQRVKSKKEELEEVLNNPDVVEEVLRLIRLDYLRERREKLRMKLREMERHYRSLVEFQERALRDKETLKEFRLKISSENARLREMLKEGKER